MYHPDINPDFKEKYLLINKAYEILSNKELRKDYDFSQGIENVFYEDKEYLYKAFNSETENLYEKMAAGSIKNSEEKCNQDLSKEKILSEKSDNNAKNEENFDFTENKTTEKKGPSFFTTKVKGLVLGVSFFALTYLYLENSQDNIGENEEQSGTINYYNAKTGLSVKKVPIII